VSLATIQQVNEAIMFGNFSNEQLSAILQAVKYRRAQITKDKVRSFWSGDNVKFVHPKTGRTHFGVVSKVKIKFISVREGNTTWNVPATLLEAA